MQDEDGILSRLISKGAKSVPSFERSFVVRRLPLVLEGNDSKWAKTIALDGVEAACLFVVGVRWLLPTLVFAWSAIIADLFSGLSPWCHWVLWGTVGICLLIEVLHGVVGLAWRAAFHSQSPKSSYLDVERWLESFGPSD